ncbi:hypothetical protein MU516_11445 [Paracoccus sp. YLB-12]|uniref:Uncharacterized protein n=1 Tax=Paracoccus maritimus TaxID=2933292 RepID=A0ABT2KA99_9RHOB|nr:hypothetical protein [Paracoccus sp. YLB-12]MCT4333477.1 hypothetical protein [Paracoccus sp. YLB-12]
MNPAYLAACLAGAIVLTVESVQQFRKPGKSVAFDRFSILRGVEIGALCTLGERVRGAAFYVGIYLLIYAGLLGSEQLLQMFVALSGEHAGPTGSSFLPDNSLTVNGLNFGKPFYIATLIMVAMVSGVLAPLERFIRSVAHRAANIPNGVFRIVEDLDRFEFPDYLDSAAPARDRFRLLSGFDHRFPDGAGWNTPSDRQDLRGFLKQIDVLHAAVIGAGRYRFFSTATTESLSDVHDLLVKSYEKLCEDLDGLKTDSPEAQTRFYQAAVDLCENMKAIFAVQFIRNGRSLTALPAQPNNPRDRLYGRLNGHLRSNEEANADALLGATLACAMGSFLAASFIYWLFVRFVLGLGVFPPDVLKSIVTQSIGLAITGAALSFFSGFFALLIRDIRREQGKWAAWNPRFPPVSRLVGTVVLPGVVGMAFVGLALLLQDLAFGYVATMDQMRDFLQDKWRYLLFFAPLGACVSLGVLIATDQHDNLIASRTILVTLAALVPAVVLALICVLIAVPNFTSAQEGWAWAIWYLREALFLLMPLAIFLISYAGLLEMSEKRKHLAAAAVAGEG